MYLDHGVQQQDIFISRQSFSHSLFSGRCIVVNLTIREAGVCSVLLV